QSAPPACLVITFNIYLLGCHHRPTRLPARQLICLLGCHHRPSSHLLGPLSSRLLGRQQPPPSCSVARRHRLAQLPSPLPTRSPSPLPGRSPSPLPARSASTISISALTFVVLLGHYHRRLARYPLHHFARLFGHLTLLDHLFLLGSSAAPPTHFHCLLGRIPLARFSSMADFAAHLCEVEDEA
ncbi:hypothetical protein Dimus_030372, partial [Dionaea muscipula]